MRKGKGTLTAFQARQAIERLQRTNTMLTKTNREIMAMLNRDIDNYKELVDEYDKANATIGTLHTENNKLRLIVDRLTAPDGHYAAKKSVTADELKSLIINPDRIMECEHCRHHIFMKDIAGKMILMINKPSDDPTVKDREIACVGELRPAEDVIREGTSV